MDVVGPAPDALNKDDILRRYPGAITELVKSCRDTQFDFERQVLINKARRAWQMVKGNHFIVPGAVSSDYGEIFDYVPLDQNAGGADIKLCPPVNVIGGDLYKFMAVMGQNAPRVKAIADDPSDPDNIAVAHNADVNVRDLWLKCKIDRQWKSLAFHQYTTGPVFLRGVWNTDASKYGQSMEPQIEIQMDETGMPFPVTTGTIAYANGDAELRIHSVLDVTIPFETKSLDECDWLRCEVMRSKWKLISQFAAKTQGKTSPLDKYRDTDVPDEDITTSSRLASEAIDSVQNPSAGSRKPQQDRWRFNEHWIKPFLFESIKDASVRKVFQEHFPDGLYVARVGSVPVELDNRKITDEWAVCRVGRGERIMEDPLCADALPIQIAIDDLFGMAIETVLRAITQTIMDSQLLDREAMQKKEAVPAEVILTAMPFDGDLRSKIFQIPPARLGDQVLPLMQMLRSFQQDIVGIRPELSGGGQPTSTYREAKQRRDQALMQLAPQADEMRFASESIAEILVRLRAKFGNGTVKAQRQGAYGMETDMADMAQLKEAGWHAEANDDFPMTLADRRDAVYSLLKEVPPEVQQALSILDPLNIEEIFELIQVPGFESAMRDQKQKTLEDIKQLSAQPPMPPQPKPDGTPGPPMPSIPVDDYDNHPIAVAVTNAWMISKTGQDLKTNFPPGFANVEAFLAQQKLMAAPPPPPPPPPPIKGNLAISMKAEDYPNLTSEILQGAGLPPPPNQAAPPPGAGGPGGGGGPVTSKPPQGTPGPEGMPPLPTTPNGPPPVPTVQ
jgi:hypothetical protein